jgi:hypothetical protein
MTIKKNSPSEIEKRFWVVPAEPAGGSKMFGWLKSQAFF